MLVNHTQTTGPEAQARTIGSGNRTAHREELASREGQALVASLKHLIGQLRAKGFVVRGAQGHISRAENGTGSDEEPDWLLAWQILALTRPEGRPLKSEARVLVLGGASTVLPFYLASENFRALLLEPVESEAMAGKRIVETMATPGLKVRLGRLDKLGGSQERFDAVFSAGLIAALDYEEKQSVLRSLAKTLQPGGLLGITFPYRTQSPFILGRGRDNRLRNRLSTPEDVKRAFFETDRLEPWDTSEFDDRGEADLAGNSADVAAGTLGVALLRRPAAFREPGPAVERVLPTAPDAVSQSVLAPRSTYLSVIVCTYKRPALLREALQSLVSQELPLDFFEVIVVDNNSQDETAGVVREFCARLPNFRYVHEEKQGLSHSRNRGCEEARGDYAIYIDDDAKAHSEYLNTVFKTTLAHGPDIMGGPIYPYYTEKKPAWFKDDYEIRRHAKETGWSTKCSISGSSFVIRRELLKSLGMFNPQLGMVGEKVRLGEEKAVLNRYRTRPIEDQKVFYHLDCIIYHHVPGSKMRPRYLLKRYFIAGHTKARIEKMTRGRWGILGRGKYIAKCWWGRCIAPVLHLKNAKLKRRFKQFLIERATGFMFEAGRLVGCLPTRRKDSVEEEA